MSVALSNGDGGVAVVQQPLVELVRGGTDRAKEWAAWALRILANQSSGRANCAAIASAGGIAPLIELVRGGTDRAKENAAYSLNYPKSFRLRIDACDSTRALQCAPNCAVCIGRSVCLGDKHQCI